MKKILQDASARAIRYLEDLDSRSVAPTPSAVEQLRAFDEPLPPKPGDPAETLRLLDEAGSPATTAMAGSRFFGFVIGGALPVALGANWIAGAWDQNTAYYRATPGTAYVEQVALRWLLDVLRLPPECAGAFVTGATVANLCALAAARHAVLKRVGWSVESEGLFGAPPITVVVGAEAHPSVTKSLGIPFPRLRFPAARAVTRRWRPPATSRPTGIGRAEKKFRIRHENKPHHCIRPDREGSKDQGIETADFRRPGGRRRGPRSRANGESGVQGSSPNLPSGEEGRQGGAQGSKGLEGRAGGAQTAGREAPQATGRRTEDRFPHGEETRDKGQAGDSGRDRAGARR